MNELKQDRILNRIENLEIQKQEWSAIISVINTHYDVIKSVFLMQNVSHLYRNACYAVYSLNKESDETLCKNISDKESDKEQCVIQELMRICQWKNDKDLFTNASWVIKTARCLNKTRSEFAQSVNTDAEINMSQIPSVQLMTVKINMFSLLKTLSSVKISTETQQILSSENHSYHFSTSSF